jgi:uncharacterized SAM-binding protein YcdF (DUF218 family)
VGLAVVVGGVLATGYATFRIWQRGTTDETRPVDAIVVLGAAQYDGTPSPVFAARLDHAVHLFAAGVAPVLVVTGGNREGDRTTEAATARAYAVAHGVPDSAILGEDHGRSTLESLEAVAGILRDHGLRSALFVSDRTHMLRVILMARDLGIEAYGSPTTTSPADAELGPRIEATLHELGALAYYGLLGGAIGPELGAPGPELGTPGPELGTPGPELGVPGRP